MRERHFNCKIRPVINVSGASHIFMKKSGPDKLLGEIKK